MWGEFMDKDKIWNEFVNQLKTKITDVTYNTWFVQLRLLTINEMILLLLCHILYIRITLQAIIWI